MIVRNTFAGDVSLGYTFKASPGAGGIETPRKDSAGGAAWLG